MNKSKMFYFFNDYQFYVMLDKVEDDGERFLLNFDGIRASLVQSNKSITELIAQPNYFTVEVPKDLINKIFNNSNPTDFESYWFYIEIGKSGYRGFQYIRLGTEEIETPVWISQLRVLNQNLSDDSSTIKYLNYQFDLYTHFKRNISAKRIIKTLKRKLKKSEKIISCVYNVGQGSLNSISRISGSSHIPFLYFDVGGGCRGNKKTYPSSSTLTICTSKNPLIVLSHWDEDHYETAQRQPSLIDGRTWIVPFQKVTPGNLNFAFEIYKRGKLIIWPRRLKRVKIHQYKFLLSPGSPKKKNDSGISLVLSLKGNKMDKVLFPGDSQYKYIPEIRNDNMDLIVASHHGGKLESGNHLPHHKFGRIIYSYGIGNIYRPPHPLQSSINFHENCGYGHPSNPGTRLDTNNGHILICNLRTSIRPACLIRCNLYTVQNF